MKNDFTYGKISDLTAKLASLRLQAKKNVQSKFKGLCE